MTKVTKADKRNIENHNADDLIDKWGIYNGCKVEALIHDDSLEFSDEAKDSLAVGRVLITENKLIWFEGYFKEDKNQTMPVFLPFYSVLKFKLEK